MPLFTSVNVHTNSYVCILKYIQPTTTIDKVKKNEKYQTNIVANIVLLINTYIR